MRRNIAMMLVVATVTLSGWSQTNPGQTRNWYDMMLDPQTNFYETQAAFYDYWKDKTPGKGMGYSVFKRWEYFWQSRVDEQGNFPKSNQVADEYRQFVEAYPAGGQLKSGQPEWLELGPRDRNSRLGYMGIGRVNAIAFHPSDENTIYLGAPAGGFWITHDGGENWVSHTDALPTLGVSAIAVHPEYPDTILIGTGDRDGGNDWGVGTMISYDGGISWAISNTGMGQITVGFFAQHETDPNTILAAGNGGIFKTEDFGQNWIQVSDNEENYRDIKYKPGDMNIAYATSHVGFYRSADGGESWTLLGENEGITASGRIVIGVSPANPDKVYLVIGGTFQGCFMSTNSGQTFTMQSNSPNILGGAYAGDDSRNQSWYDLYIHIDPFNANIVHVGGINTWRSDDAGKTWTITSHWAGDRANEVHADHHCVAYNYLNNRMYDGNDGGIYWTADQGVSWTDISVGLGIGQMYKLGVSATNRNKTMAGFQDNGSATLMDDGWYTTGGGDGFECMVDPFTDAYSYSSVYYGSIARWINNGGAQSIAGENRYGIDESGAWVTPYTLSEWDGNTMIIGYKNIWISQNVKTQGAIKWTKITDNLGNSNTTNCAVVEASPVDENLFFFGRHDRTLFRTENLLENPVWVNLTNKLPANITISDLECHPYQRNVLFMTQGTRVYQSQNMGTTWTDISGNLPQIPMNDIAFDRSADEGLYVASDAGVYYKDANSENWTLHGLNLPVTVEVSEIEIYYGRADRSECRLKASTYGRGMWEVELAAIEPFARPPYFLDGLKEGRDVELSWNPPLFPNQVVSYSVYRNGEQVATTSGTTYLDRGTPDDLSLTYTVTANYQDGSESKPSNELYFQAPISLPYTQNFESGSQGWETQETVNNWKLGDSQMHKLSGNSGLFYGITSAYADETDHVQDYLFSPEVKLSGYSGQTVTLSFNLAFRIYLNHDKLAVVYRPSPSDDWVPIQQMEATASNRWIWKEQRIELPEDAFTDNLQIGFHYDDGNAHAWGAAIDDVQLFVNTSQVIDLPLSNTLTVYPNPNTGHFTIDMQLVNPGDIVMRLYDLSGREVWNKRLVKSSGRIKEKIVLPASLTKGVYQLSVLTDQDEQVQSITIH